MLSVDGLCRAFGADAHGYVRSEGGIVLVLKRLDDAKRAGDPIHAVLCASGVNSDGHTAGLARPSRNAQAALLRTIYDGESDLLERLCYFEAHGTGTAVGDLIEAEAIGKAVGQRIQNIQYWKPQSHSRSSRWPTSFSN